MYELNKVRLIGIGPRGARYSDVTLDFSGVGQLVPTGTLTDPDARRPSPYTLLMLENGGGKSVLLKLIFSVVLPGRRKTIGGASLENFVLEGDTGHVALEWMHVKTGQRLVTAKAYQRRTRTASNSNPLVEAWYSFQPTDDLALENLPVNEGDRRRRVEGFREALEAADRDNAAAQLAWLGDDQSRWRNHLRASGIDPDLFDIQRSMNVDEGDAADAFKFTSAKQFIDWLLTTVTDPADATAIAGTFEEYAVTLAAREGMLVEHAFLEGAIAGLEPVAELQVTLGQAQADGRRAEHTAAHLLAQLEMRVEHEDDAVQALREELEEQTQNFTRRETDRDTARNILNEIRRQTITLRLADAEAKRNATTEAQATNADELAAWEVVPLLAKLDQLEARSRELAAAVATADSAAEPALRRRDSSAADLLAKLYAEAETRRTNAHRERGEATRLTAEAAGHEASLLEHNTTEARASARLAALRARVEEATAAIELAVRGALLPTGATIADVGPALEVAESRLDRDRGELTKAADQLKAARDAHAKLVTRHGQAAKDLTAREGVHRDADKDLSQARHKGADISAHPLVRTLAGADTEGHDVDLSAEELDASVENLTGLLTDLLTDAQNELNDLTREQSADQHVLDALGNGGLLPPREAVARALSVLATAGVNAHAGWRYLNEAASAASRLELAQAHPHLADGIVLANPAQADTARAALESAQMLPSAAIAVGSGAALLNAGNAPSGHFTVEPTPAMYDDDAAEERRQLVVQRMDVRADRRGVAAARVEEITGVRADFGSWRRTYPTGALARLVEAESTAAARVQEAQTKLDEVGGARDEAARRVEDSEETLDLARRREREQHDIVVKLDSLRSNTDPLLGAARLASELDEALQNAQAEGERARAQRDVATKQVKEAERRELAANAAAAAFEAEANTVSSTDGTRAAAVPTQSLNQLRQNAAAAHAIYLSAATKPELVKESEAAAEAARAHADQILMRDQRSVARGRDLLAGAASTDRSVWSLAAAEARTRAAELRDQVSVLDRAVGRLEREETEARPAEGRRVWIGLPEAQTPTSIGHGDGLRAAAAATLREAQQLLDEANKAVSSTMTRLGDARENHRQFREAVLPLGPLVRAHGQCQVSAAAPYPGNARGAVLDSEEVGALLERTAALVATAAADFDSSVADVKAFAGHSSYDTIEGAVRRAIIDSRPHVVGARAAEWSTALTARMATLVSDLENATKHRGNIVRRLSSLAEQAIGTLRMASRLSRLPDSLGDWSGKEFLRIRFSQPDAATVSLRVGDVVDTVAAQTAGRAPSGRGTAPKRDGMALLLESVHACVPKGFSVEILKPDSVLRDERVPVENMNDVLSGGQELTSAIVLYCTLAALRANQRGQMRSRHSGVLFLDNPIGKASASYLLDVQKGVADALGVQLVYTTGLYDDRVLASFPLWVRMRNDADLRAGLKHITVSETVRGHLPEPYDSDRSEMSMPGTVTATRVHVRAQPDPVA